MTYDEALEKIHSFNVFGSRLGLERMKKLLEILGDPHKDMKVIHVAGTNGKGSVCRYVYSILTECGYRVGAYFSPYLERFTERIEFAGREIPADDLVRCTEIALDAVSKMMAEGYESPTEFELVTAIGMIYFAQQDADFIILEVGLGGIGDSTNVCDKPMVTAVTSISYDHMAQLGNTLEEIAANKAGILKSGVPVVACVDDPGAERVIMERAIQLDAPYIDVKKSEISNVHRSVSGYGFDISTGSSAYKGIKLSMTGEHQINNAACALNIIDVLRSQGISIPPGSVAEGLAKAVQPGRFEVMSKDPLIIIDGAHNQAGVEAMVKTVKDNLGDARILFCTGILADKDFSLMASVIAELKADIIVTTVPNPRTLGAEDLGEVFRELEIYKSGKRSVKVYSDYKEAVRAALDAAADYDAVVWAGSLYLIGAVRAELRG